MAPSDNESVERYSEGVWVEALKGPLSQVAVAGGGHGGCFEVLRDTRVGRISTRRRPGRRM